MLIVKTMRSNQYLKSSKALLFSTPYFFLHLFNNQHTNSEKIASIKTNRIRENPGKKDEGRPCAWYSGYDNACVPSPESVALSFLPVAEDITTLPPGNVCVCNGNLTKIGENLALESQSFSTYKCRLNLELKRKLEIVGLRN